jgi:predicted amino acid-binding ACT domain protein
MALKVKGVDVWVAGMKDRVGALAAKLKGLAAAGAQLEFVISRRSPEKPGTGVVFVTPLKGEAQMKAARALGFRKTKKHHAVRVEGADKPGLGAKMTGALAAARINLRGVSAAAIGKRFVAYIAADTPADAAKVMRILKKLS